MGRKILRKSRQSGPTFSDAIRALSPTWEMPELDIIQKHEYSDQIFSGDRDLAERPRRTSESWPRAPRQNRSCWASSALGGQRWR